MNLVKNDLSPLADNGLPTDAGWLFPEYDFDTNRFTCYDLDRSEASDDIALLFPGWQPGDERLVVMSLPLGGQPLRSMQIALRTVPSSTCRATSDLRTATEPS